MHFALCMETGVVYFSVKLKRMDHDVVYFSVQTYMQNLQIRYPQNSAQVEYLSLFELVDEGEVEEEREDLAVDFDCGHLEFNEKETQGQCSQEHCDLHCFVRETVRVDRWISQLPTVRVVEAFALAAMGDLFEHVYHLAAPSSTQTRRKAIFIEQHRWTVLGHFLFFFLSVCIFPIQTTIIICLLVTLLTTEQHESQLQKWQASPKQLTQSIRRLKLFCMGHQPEIAVKQIPVNQLLDQLVISLSKSFWISLPRSSNLLDDLDEMVFRVNKQHRDSNKVNQFMECKNWVAFKLSYWRIHADNYRMSRAVSLIDRVIEAVDLCIAKEEEGEWEEIKEGEGEEIKEGEGEEIKEGEGEEIKEGEGEEIKEGEGEEIKEGEGEEIKKEEKGRSKDEFAELYYAVLSSRLEKLAEKQEPSERDKRVFQNMLGVVRKEMSLKTLLALKTFKEVEQVKQVKEEESEEEKGQSQLFVESRREQVDLLCYSDAEIQSCVPEDFKSISQRLQNILKQRQQNPLKSESNGQKEQKMGTLTDCQVLPRERRSFGIPVMPPARDLSAFYLQ